MKTTSLDSDFGPQCSFANAQEALSAFTHQQLKRLTAIAAKRLHRLSRHPGFARHFSRRSAEDFVHDAIERVEEGTRRVQTKHLVSASAFFNYMQGVVQSLVNNTTRHAEPQVEHLTIGQDCDFSVDPAAALTVLQDIEDREQLRRLLPALRARVAEQPELSADLEAWERKLNAASGLSAAELLASCPAGLLGPLTELTDPSGLSLSGF